MLEYQLTVIHLDKGKVRGSRRKSQANIRQEEGKEQILHRILSIRPIDSIYSTFTIIEYSLACPENRYFTIRLSRSKLRVLTSVGQRSGKGRARNKLS
jgi:hypothetical protein